MGAFCKGLTILSLLGLPVVLHLFLNDCLSVDEKLELPEKKWFGPGSRPTKEDSSIKPFKAEIDSKTLEDLKKHIASDMNRLTDPLEDTGFNFGFNTKGARPLLEYWRDSYNWRNTERQLNQFPQFKTNIDGIDIHFIRAQPTQKVNRPTLPLLMLHGWPGSVLEFLKIIPLLTDPPKEIPFAFEVIAPSIPGYGFSSKPVKKGLDAPQAARIFRELMLRLGHEKFYTQGGDWGGMILYCQAVLYPETILGYHTNFAQPALKLGSTVKKALAHNFPSLFANSDELFMLKKSYGEEFGNVVLESGYLHEQATKPDTLGVGLGTSPTGLAAWILEKFSTASNAAFRDLDDGGLLSRVNFSKDEMLGDVTLYWVTNTMTSAVRFYKENFKHGSTDFLKVSGNALTSVPTGIAIFPNEIGIAPKSLLENKYRNIITYTIQPKGGHFAALEEPELLAKDFITFIKTARAIKQAKEEL